MNLRSRRVVLGTLAAAVSRGAATIVPLLTVPLALHVMGVPAYGAWASALSLTALVVFADLGLGAGLMTRLVAPLQKEDWATARAMVSSAYTSVSALAFVLLSLLWGSSPFVDWGNLLGGSQHAGDAEIETVALIAFSGFLISAPFGLIVRIQYAAQQFGRSNLWQTASTLAGLASAFLCVALGTEPSTFVLAATLTPIVVTLANTALFFARPAWRQMRPSPRAARLDVAFGLLKLGGVFLLISTLMALSLGVDTWIVGRSGSLDDAAAYAILYRVFNVVGALVAVLSMPLWPTHAEALASGDVSWVRNTTRRMVLISPLTVLVFCTTAALLLPWLLPVWLGDESLQISLVAVWGFVAFNTATACAAPLFMVQNAAGKLGPQLVGYVILLAVIPLKWAVAAEAGYALLPWLSAVAYLLVVLPSAIVGYRLSLRQRVSARSPEVSHA